MSEPVPQGVAMTDTTHGTLLAELATKDCLAEVLCRQGKQHEGEALLRDALETRKTVLGQTPEHPDVRRTMNNLAGTLMPHKSIEAEMLFRQVFEADEKADGYEHVHTIISMNNLAEFLSRQGKNEEAEDMMRRTVKSSQTVRGLHHPETVALIDNLRELLGRQGKIEEAEQMLRQRPKLHQSLAESQKECDEQEQSRRNALVLCQTDIERIIALRNLAELLETKGRYREAEAVLQQSVDSSTDVLSGSDQELRSSLRNLGVLKSRQHKYKEAEEIFRSLLEDGKTELD